MSAGRCGRARLARPSLCSPPATTPPTRSSGWSWAPTTTWPSRSIPRSWWRASARCCGARPRPPTARLCSATPTWRSMSSGTRCAAPASSCRSPPVNSPCCRRWPSGRGGCGRGCSCSTACPGRRSRATSARSIAISRTCGPSWSRTRASPATWSPCTASATSWPTMRSARRPPRARRPPVRSLGMRLALAFLAVIVVSTGGVALLASRETSDAFQTYVERGRYGYLDRVLATLQEYYRRRGDWAGIEAVLPSLARPQDRLVLADPAGRVIADSEEEARGQPASALGLGPGVPLVSDGQVVGTLYAALAMPSSWRGPRTVVVEGSAKGPVLRALVEGKEPGPRAAAEPTDSRATAGIGGRGEGAEREARHAPPRQVVLGPEILRPPPTTISPEASFMERVGRALLVSALAAAALAALLSLLLARQLAQPLRELAAGARALAAGNLRQRVPVRGHDEVAELAVAFNDMAASLERAETARRNLVADVAHELRTPLTVIEGTVDAMLAGVYPADRERLEPIRDETRLLAKLVADLRELSLADVGALRLEREPLEPAALVRRAVAAASARAAARGVELRGQVEDALPLVLADEQRVTQVLANLLDNALRYTGPGIAPADLPHIFERFYRADPSRSRRSGGSGLGLAIARGYVEAHGGRIWAESAPGEGATFRFWLPAGPAPVQVPAPAALPAAARA